jgi:hypothetical protein
MPVAILIGFEYKKNILSGMMFDIQNAYKWCKSFNCEIHVFTDKKLKPKFNLIGSSLDLFSKLDLILKNIKDDKLIIYYTGHGVDESMLMPDNQLVSFINFRDRILNIINPYVEIFWILDCCNPNGLYLPFKLEKNRFVLSDSKIKCVTQPILLITSSNSDEKSISTKTGSFFSRYLFDILKSFNNEKISKKCNDYSQTRNLELLIETIIKNIKRENYLYSQSVNIYSSYVIDPILWTWIGSKKNYDIVTDMSLSFLIIRSKKEDEIKKEKYIKQYKNPYDETYGK